MKTSRIALLAGLGVIAMILPAAAAPATSDGTDVRAKPTLVQFAQYGETRAASEVRSADLKKAKKAKKPKKKKKK